MPLPRVAYFKTEGVAHDIRFVAEDYELQEGELETRAEPLPTSEALSEP
jgi:hypothetical protein